MCIQFIAVCLFDLIGLVETRGSVQSTKAENQCEECYRDVAAVNEFDFAFVQAACGACIDRLDDCGACLGIGRLDDCAS